MIIINADDFGRSVAETEAAAVLAESGPVTSVSAMVFMPDSERAAALATQMEIDVGLHLNFCERWISGVPRWLAIQHESLVAFFNRSQYALLVYNPRLRDAFKAVYQAQVDEFQRLYGRLPSHIDGHHHLHLCANMLVDAVIPRGFGVRRNFTFAPEEKGLVNRAYRRLVDTCLGRRYVLTDYFFSLEQCLSGRGRPLRRVVDLAKVANVEIMTHPRKSEEFDYLAGQQCVDVLGTVTKGTYAELSVKRPRPPWILGTLVASLCEWILL
jgi:predicted glycoside hydrolase/deacetylase ChbG (UPF0249 family)